MELSAYEQTLLQGWEDVYKKSQLTFWILLALSDGPKHMQEIKDFISARTGGTIEADDKSMYRALRRYTDAELMTYKTKESKAGPEKKIYVLSRHGKKVLAAFIDRNISEVLTSERTMRLLKKARKL